jgi:glycosyltransferase involved in cell wall biosynthesis
MIPAYINAVIPPIKVRLFFRKTRPTGNVSIENSFAEIVDAFPKNNGFTLDTFVSSFYSNGFLPRLRAIFEVRQHQVAINHITGDTNFLALGLPHRKTILTIHDCGLLDGKNKLARWILLQFWLKLPVKKSQIVTAVSEATKQDIIRLTGCDADKIAVIPTVIKSSFSYSPKAFQRDYPTILHIGNSPNKNLERHAHALAGLPCHLHIVGQISTAQIDLLKHLKLDFSISYNLTDAAMQSAYEQADILLFCSTIEGFGMPIIEAQTVGRVVVTSTVSAMPDVSGGGACLADPLSISDIRRAIERVLTDDNYRNSLIDKGLQNIKRFNPETVARQYAALYEAIEARQRRLKQNSYAHPIRSYEL